MVLEGLSLPIVLAPLAGGPSTPELAAAVSGAGALGFFALGYLSPEQAREGIERVRGLTDAPFGVNMFVPASRPAATESYAGYTERVSEWARARDLPVGEPRFDDDGWEGKLELLCERPPAVVSFTFGCPSAATVQRLRAAGAETWVTVTRPEEAEQAAAAGAEVLVAQGAEAGGHRGSFEDVDEQPPIALAPLLSLLRARVPTALVAAGGIADGAAVAAALAGGARAAQLGSAFMLCPEAGTSEAQRSAFASGRPTELTRAFTGRLARGIRNEFLAANRGAPRGYPEIHHLTAPMRREARARGDAEAINLWAGESYALAREQPAAELVAELAEQARAAAARAGAILKAAR